MTRKRQSRDTDVPNQTANKAKAEVERWSSEPDTVERREHDRSAESVTGADEGGGITNRPIGEELHNQDLVPGRGEARRGAHAGHGDPNRPIEEE
jgi:hypothetical protein